MSARIAEIIQIRAPIKKQIQHLDGRIKKVFPKLLNEVVQRLRQDGYKLIHVTKSYRKKGTVQSDNFWRKETRVGGIRIVWLCTLTVAFESGFKFKFDFDFWFEFSKLLQNLRGELYQEGFPYTSRDYAEHFGKREATQALEKIRKELGKKMKSRTGGWGEHGIKKEVLDRKPLDICHRREFSISTLSELDELRETLSELNEKAVETVKESKEEIDESTREKLEELIPFTIKPSSPEGYLAFFLWFRKPGGGFEYQLYRFIQENYGKVVKKEKIRDALLRLEVHRYLTVKEVPKNLWRKMKKWEIDRCRRFYEAEEEIPGQKLFDELKGRANIGAYLSPLPRKRLIKKMDAPSHLASKGIGKLTRKNFLTDRKVKDYLGRTVRKVKPKRSSRSLSGLERRIAEKAGEFYDVQKSCLDQMQEERP